MRFAKVITGVAISAALTISATACSMPGEGGSSSNNASGDGPIVIGFSQATQQSPFYVALSDAARQIAQAVLQGVQVAVVVGGGNFFRGAELSQAGMDRSVDPYLSTHPLSTSRIAVVRNRMKRRFRALVRELLPERGALDKLEEEVGHPLVNRDKPTTLTPAGAALAKDAPRLIAEAPEHVRSRVVPQLTLEWAPADVPAVRIVTADLGDD